MCPGGLRTIHRANVTPVWLVRGTTARAPYLIIAAIPYLIPPTTP